METYKTTNLTTGEPETVAAERWGWAVIYQPTQEQYDDQKRRTLERNRELNAQIIELAKEFDARAEMIRRKLPDDADEQTINDALNADAELVALYQRINNLKVEKEVGQPVVRDELHQFGSDGTFHRIGEVEQDEVELFVLYRLDDPTKRIDLVVPKGAKLIHKYRNIKPYYLPEFVRVYVFGYKLGNVYHYNYILPDDRIVQGVADSTQRLKELETAIEHAQSTLESLTQEYEAAESDDDREALQADITQTQANIERWTHEMKAPSDPAIDLTRFELNRGYVPSEHVGHDHDHQH